MPAETHWRDTVVFWGGLGRLTYLMDTSRKVAAQFERPRPGREALQVRDAVSSLRQARRNASNRIGG